VAGMRRNTQSGLFPFLPYASTGTRLNRGEDHRSSPRIQKGEFLNKAGKSEIQPDHTISKEADRARIKTAWQASPNG
jgi:hypothetical protein